MASDRPTVSEPTPEALEAAADFLVRCRGTEAWEIYEGHAATVRAAAARIREKDRANAKLREFANRIISEMQLEVEGVQDIAVECGLLESIEVTEACDPDHCYCAEWGFPATCFRRTALLRTESEDRNG